MLASTINDAEEKFHNDIIKDKVVPSKFNNLDIYKLESTNTKYYYKEIVKKKAIVLHYTEGFLKYDIIALTGTEHKSVSFVLARNGKIYQLFDPKYWSYHLGPDSMGQNKICSSQTIGIEISNIGALTLKGKILYDIYKKKYCNLSETKYYKKLSYRGKKYYATFTDAQYQSLKKLILAICIEFNIPYTFLPEDKRLETFDNPTAMNYSGICTHVNFRNSKDDKNKEYEKYDIGPAFDWNAVQILHLPQCDISQQNIIKSYKKIDINCFNQFPIASYGCWHNGIHLSCNKSNPLYSMFDGQVIYSRISAENNIKNGSPNFVLIKYKLDLSKTKSITFYALYMHLEKIDIQTKLTNKKDIDHLPIWIKQQFYKENNCDKNGDSGCQTFLTLHSWAVESNQNPKKELFQNALSYEQPVNVFSGQIIGYASDALSHVEILKQDKTIKKKKTQCHLEIFSRKMDNDQKDIYTFLDLKPKNYILLEDQNNDILNPQKEKRSIIIELEKKIAEFKKINEQNIKNGSSAKENVNKEDLKKFIKDYQIKFRDCVALHISNWQALYAKIEKKQYASIDELKAYALFTPSDKKEILTQKEKLFFYHPIRFLEIINNQNSIQKSESDMVLNVKGPKKAHIFDNFIYTAELISKDKNTKNFKCNWTIRKKSTNKKIKNFINYGNKVDFYLPIKKEDKKVDFPIKKEDIIVTAFYYKKLSLEKSIETQINYFIGEVFWSARDLDGFFEGNHHFITVKFNNKQSADKFCSAKKIVYKIIDSQYFFTVACFKNENNGYLECEFNNKSDVQSVSEDINPDLKGFWSDYDYESHIVNPPAEMNSLEFIDKIVQLSLNYIENQKKNESVKYTVANYNYCAAWVNTLFKKIGISDEVRLEKGELSGFNWGEMFDKK